MNDKAQGTTQTTITVELPVKDIPEQYASVFVRGYPFGDADAQQWTMSAAPIETPDGIEHLLVLNNGKMGYYKMLGVVEDGVNQYQLPVNHENEGGGALTLPYTLVWNKKHTKVVDIEVVFREEPRKRIISDPDSPTNLGVLAGFQDPGETSEEAAVREHIEESDGIQPDVIREVSERRSVANRAFDLVVDELEGLKVFAYEMSAAKRAEFEGNPTIKVLSWTQASQSRDQMVKGAVLDLLMWVKTTYKTAL